MNLQRRAFLAATASAVAMYGARSAKLQIGVTDWNLGQTAKPEAIRLAKRLGFEGVQVSLGQTPLDGRLPLADAGLQATYLAEAKAQGMAINSTCLDILHVNPLKNDPLGRKWLADSISITRKLGAQIVLLPFFGKGALISRAEMDFANAPNAAMRVTCTVGALISRAEMDFAGDVLREMAPEAERAKAILGLENTVSAEDNLRIIERARSKAVMVYYDVGNSGNNGFDVAKEIRLLGNKQICQFHFKDNPHYLGEGRVDWNAVLHAIMDIGYRGWANLETVSPSKSVEADLKRNLIFVLRLAASSGV